MKESGNIYVCTFRIYCPHCKRAYLDESNIGGDPRGQTVKCDGEGCEKEFVISCETEILFC
jgi:hypothetical protein